MKDKENIKPLLIALGGLVAVVGIAFFGYKMMFTPKESNPVQTKVETKSIKGFGATPEEAVTKFISVAGSMGNNTEVNYNNLNNGTAFNNNFQRRWKAVTEVEKGLVDGSPLSRKKESAYLKDYAERLASVDYYSIKDNSITVSKAYDKKQITINSAANGAIKYNSMKVKANFTAEHYSFVLERTDSTSDGSYVENLIPYNFENIVFTVVEVGDNQWRIYNIKDSENYIGEYFATWDTTTEVDRKFVKARQIDRISPPREVKDERARKNNKSGAVLDEQQRREYKEAKDKEYSEKDTTVNSKNYHKDDDNNNEKDDSNESNDSNDSNSNSIGGVV